MQAHAMKGFWHIKREHVDIISSAPARIDGIYSISDKFIELPDLTTFLLEGPAHACHKAGMV